MRDSGPLFVTSGDLVSDRRYKAAVELAAVDVLAQTSRQRPASPRRGLRLAPSATGSAITMVRWRRFGRRAAPTRTIITARGCSWRGSVPARQRQP